MMDNYKSPFCLVLSALILAGFILSSKHIFSEETKPAIIKEVTQSGRRVLPIKKWDKKKMKGTEDAKLNLGGVLMWDYDQFNGVHLGRAKKDYKIGNETELRRARIDIECKIDNDWQAEFQVSFEDGDQAPEVEDAFIAFTRWDYLTFMIGQTKEPFGLEELTSSKHISLIERSMATNAFAPGNNPGFGISGYLRPLTWAIGVYEAVDHDNKRDTYALTGRFVFTPWEHEKRILHIGAAGSLRDFNGEGYEIETHAEVNTAEEIVKSVKIQADKVNLLGAEFASAFGPFSLQAEHMSAMIKTLTSSDASYTGYYIQGTYFLTGETRPYKKGVFKRIKPLNTYGALELVSRYSFLDAEDNNKGVRVSNFTLGVNYYLNKWIRLMTNYIRTALIDGVSEVEGKADAISFRMQYDF